MKYYLVSPGCELEKGSRGVSPRKKNGREFYWMSDAGEKWEGVARGIHRPKHEKDVVKDIAEAGDITELDWTKTPFHDDTLRSGWLSRSGRFRGCPAVHHDVFARCVLGRTVGELERLGWARVLDSQRFVCEQRLSAEQKNWLLENGYNVLDIH